jgi:hypothetical protein
VLCVLFRVVVVMPVAVADVSPIHPSLHPPTHPPTSHFHTHAPSAGCSRKRKGPARGGELASRSRSLSANAPMGVLPPVPPCWWWVWGWMLLLLVEVEVEVVLSSTTERAKEAWSVYCRGVCGGVGVVASQSRR